MYLHACMCCCSKRSFYLFLLRGARKYAKVSHVPIPSSLCHCSLPPEVFLVCQSLPLLKFLPPEVFLVCEKITWRNIYIPKRLRTPITCRNDYNSKCKKCKRLRNTITCRKDYISNCKNGKKITNNSYMSKSLHFKM